MEANPAATDEGVWEGQAARGFAPIGPPGQSGPVYSLYRDPAGRLWAGGDNKLLAFDGQEWQVQLEPAEPDPILAQEGGGEIRALTAVLTRSTVTLWSGTQSGTLHHLNYKLGERTHIPANLIHRVPYRLIEDFPEYPLTPMAADREGRLWIGTRGEGITAYDRGLRKRYTVFHHDLPTNEIWSLAIAPDGAIWVGGTESVVRKGAAQEEWITLRNHLPGQAVTDIVFLSPARAWMGYHSKGVLALEHASGQIRLYGPRAFDQVSSCGGFLVQSLHLSDDVLWVGSKGGGVWATELPW